MVRLFVKRLRLAWNALFQKSTRRWDDDNPFLIL